eukprot:133108-Amphidinium_carterae.1
MLPAHSAFLQRAPNHIRDLYSDKVFPLVFLSLLDRLNFPDQHLRDDLLNGFTLIGDMHEGVGWPPRADDKYNQHLPLDTLYTVNRGYLSGLISNQRHEPHWQ